MRSAIIDAARSRKGIAWKHQGRSRYGLDCVGLVIEVAKEVGIVCEDMPAYTRTTYQNTFLKEFRRQMVQKPLTERTPGDVLLLRDNTYPCHVVILAEDKRVETVIHTSPRRRGTIEEPLAPLLERVTACFTFKETEGEAYRYGSTRRTDSIRDRRIRSRSVLRESRTRNGGR